MNLISKIDDALTAYFDVAGKGTSLLAKRLDAAILILRDLCWILVGSAFALLALPLFLVGLMDRSEDKNKEINREETK